MTNKDKFLLLVSEENTEILKRNKERIKNRPMLRQSQNIAIKVLMKLDELGWSQKNLATKMEVSPQQVNKIVSGKENLTLETQEKLQRILDVPILASYYENKEAPKVRSSKNYTKSEVYLVTKNSLITYRTKGILKKMTYPSIKSNSIFQNVG